MKEKINITIDKDLLEKIKKKAKEYHINVSACVALLVQGRIKL